MNMKLIIVSFLFVSVVKAQFMWQFKKDTVIKWNYFDGDEFNAKSIDKQKWRTSFSWTEMNFDMKYKMTSDRIVLDSGICHFICNRDTGLYEIPGWLLDSTFKKKYGSQILEGNKMQYFFTAGDILSKQKYERGYFELRFKTTGAYGMYPGYWLYGSNGDEIDFFELKGERSKEIHIDIHCKGNCDKRYKGKGILPHSFGEWIKVTEPLNNGYNVLAGEWGDGYVNWYLNGNGIAFYKGNFGSDKMDIILGTGPAQDGKPFAPGVNERTKFPNSFDVDYIRVWYKANQTITPIKKETKADFDYYKDVNEGNAKIKRKINYLYNKKDFDNDLLTISVLPKRGKKVIVSSLGKEVSYTITFIDDQDKVIRIENVTSKFNEFDFSSLTNEELGVQLKVFDKIVSEKIKLF